MYCTSAFSLHLKQYSWPPGIASQVLMMGIGSKALLEDWQISWYLGIFGWYGTPWDRRNIYIYIFTNTENIRKWWGSLEAKEKSLTAPFKTKHMFEFTKCWWEAVLEIDDSLGFPPPTVRREKGFRGSSTCDSNPGGRFFISACNFSWICLEKYRHLVTQNVVGCGEVSQQKSQDMPKFILCLKHSQLRWTRRPLLVLGNRDDSWQDRFGGLTMEKTIIEATGKNHKTNTLLLVEYQSLGEANKIKKY